LTSNAVMAEPFPTPGAFAVAIREYVPICAVFVSWYEALKSPLPTDVTFSAMVE